MIEQAVWSTRGIERKSYTAKEMYEAENTSTLTGKECSATNSDGSANEYCTDTVTRKTEWEGKIGLIYPSDWGYASTDPNCEAILNQYGPCKDSNWMYTDSWYWTISPNADSDLANIVWGVGVGAGSGDANRDVGVRAATYLMSNVQIIGGNGNTIPYKLSA